MVCRLVVVLVALQFGIMPAFAQRGGGSQPGPGGSRGAVPAPQGGQGGGSGARTGAPARQSPGQPGARDNAGNTRPPAYGYNGANVYGPYVPNIYIDGAFGWYPGTNYAWSGGSYGQGGGYNVGEVRLRVEPRWAEVYVDGHYTGTVDDFDGANQGLKLEPGPYHLEIGAPGYRTLEVNIRTTPGQKITYRGSLRPER